MPVYRSCEKLALDIIAPKTIASKKHSANAALMRFNCFVIPPFFSLFIHRLRRVDTHNAACSRALVVVHCQCLTFGCTRVCVRGGCYQSRGAKLSIISFNYPERSERPKLTPLLSSPLAAGKAMHISGAGDQSYVTQPSSFASSHCSSSRLMRQDLSPLFIFALLTLLCLFLCARHVCKTKA